jgi:hypothetical protein
MVSLSGPEAFEFFASAGMTEFAQGFGFDLPYALAGD